MKKIVAALALTQFIAQARAIPCENEARPMDTLSRYEGSLLGLAVGDAMGAPVEFQRRDTFEPVIDMRAGGVFNLEKGQWTDDTSMALCLSESLLERNGFSPVDQMQRYLRWWQEGYLSSTGNCFDIGNTTVQALRNYEITGSPFSGIKTPNSAGNGALMRLAAVPLFFARQPSEAIRLSGESARTTHELPIVIDANRYFASILIGALEGRTKEELLSPYFKNGSETWQTAELDLQIFKIAAGNYRSKKRNEISSTGYVVHTLEAVLWSFAQTSSFEEGLLLAVNLGEDSDTIGAIYGQLAGAYYGIGQIPSNWLQALHQKDFIQNIAQALYHRRP